MSTTECATDPDLAERQGDPPAEPAPAKPRKNVLVGFAATVTVGLALAIWYVGVRIVDANEAVPASTAASTQAKVSATPVTPALQPPAAATTSKHEQTTLAPAPPPPNLYLQVAGLGPRQDATFMKSLAAKGYRASMIESAGGTTDQDDRRILIGPFVGHRSLEKAERKLESAGVLALEVTF
jgi:cell division septation protein DedD